MMKITKLLIGYHYLARADAQRAELPAVQSAAQYCRVAYVTCRKEANH